MISAVAMEDLRRFADEGRIGAGIVALSLSADNLHPFIEEMVTVRWNLGDGGADMGELSISDLGRFAVPAVGERRIQVGAMPLPIELWADGQSANLVIEPRAVIPHVIGFSAMGRAVLDEPVTIAWQIADAQSCTLVIQDGAQVSEHEVMAQEAVQITPRNMSPLQISIVARSRHADFAEEATIRAELQVAVAAPPVRIEVAQKNQSGFIGDEVEFAWGITGAVSARLVAVDRDQQLDVPVMGALRVEVVCIEPEKFLLIATGADGAEHTTNLAVTAKLLDINRHPEELSYLNLGWE